MKENNINKAILIVLAVLVCFVVGTLLYKNSQKNFTNNTNYTYNTDSKKDTYSKLSIDDIEMKKTFYDINDVSNEATERILAAAWSYITNLYPNAKWKEMTIAGADGYGRYKVIIKYVKSTASERGNTEELIVCVKDINDWSKIFPGFSTDWGKPLK